MVSFRCFLSKKDQLLKSLISAFELDIPDRIGICCKKTQYSRTVHVREPLAEGIFGFKRMIIRKILKFAASQIIAISRDNATRVGLLN